MTDWLLAIGLTLCVEVPVYAWLLRTPWRRRLIAAFGTSVLTHPYVWFVLPTALMPFIGYWGYVAVAELFAFAVEAAVCVVLGSKWRRASLASLVANGLSFGMGWWLLG